MSNENQPCVDAAALTKIQKEVVERFLRYVRIDTQSDEESGLHPSTSKQFDLARVLVSELEALGVEYFFDEKNCYLYASLAPSEDPSSSSDPSSPKALAGAASSIPAIGFVAHMDTSPEASGANVDPKIVENYDGGDILLGGASASSGSASSDAAAFAGASSASPEAPSPDASGAARILSPKDFPELLKYKGQTLITSDGSTLLGADDKAGVAEIVTAMEYLIQHPEIKHGTIRVGFTPDEEIGEGPDHFDVAAFGAEFGYTMDGGAIGELEFENFNAAALKVKVNGINVHPGYGYNKMKNAQLIAMQFNAMLPPDETPATTRGYEGFFHLISMSGSVEEANLSYIIRDHDRDHFEARKQLAVTLAEQLNEEYGAGTVEVTTKDQYYNMREMVEPKMFIIDLAKEAMKAASVTPKVQPIRGGTDGARLSFVGLPCPNIFAGGENFHSRFEYLPIPSMEKACEVILEIVKRVK